MILIWDNGMDYSSHSIDFVELGDTAPAHAVELMKMHDSDGYAIGLAERIDWWQGGAAALFDVVSPWSADEKTPDVPPELFLRVLEYEDVRLQKLLADAKESSPGLAGWHRNIEHKIAATKERLAIVRGDR